MVFLQGIPGTVPWGVFFVFLNDFYSHDKGFSVQSATLLVMVIGAAAILGGYLGGLLGDHLYNRDPRYLPILCGVTTLLGILPTAALLTYPAQAGLGSIAVPMAIGVLTGALAAVTGSNVRAMLINVTAPETRGSVFSLYNLADDLGKGLGPWIIGGLVGMFGRVVAFNVANLFWVFCGIILLLMARTFPRDEAALQERLRARG
jgi:predicted MFS family arabinose efflux permease